MLFDNSLNDKRFRIDIWVENGYEEGCKRGANQTRPPTAKGLLVCSGPAVCWLGCIVRERRPMGREVAEVIKSHDLCTLLL